MSLAREPERHSCTAPPLSRYRALRDQISSTVDTGHFSARMRPLGLRQGCCLVPADFIHLGQRFLEIVAVRIFKIVNCQKYLVTRRPDPLQVEMRFGKDARGN